MIEVRPIGPSTPQSQFGWACDGAVVNSTRGFALTALALFIVGQWQQSSAVPPEIIEALVDIKVKYTKHKDMQSRVVASLIESAVNNRVNRSIDDPIFLANELSNKSLSNPAAIKATLAAYKHRLLANPHLHMKENTEHCILRFMLPDKVTAQAKRRLLTAFRR